MMAHTRRIGLVTGWLLAGMAAASAANLVLPGYFGNKEGCEFLRTGEFQDDMHQVLTREYLGSYGMSCTFVDVNADDNGIQRADAICSHEGEETMSAEDFIIAPNETGMSVFTRNGDLWGALMACS